MLYVGTSGWQYSHWKGVFYPDKLAQREWLRFYAERFQTVEVNNTFYMLPEAAVFEQWRKQTPGDFVFALKMSRYLTHVKRLIEPAQPVHRFLDRAKKLGSKIGPVLLQLPPRFHADVTRLDETLSAIGKSVRVAVEFRDESWYSPETREILERHHAALCLADSPRRKQPAWRTADWGFVRFHEGRGRRAPGYERDVLRRWAQQVAATWDAGQDVYVYFNNDTEGYAVGDAVTFAELAEGAGLRPTRVPAEVAS